MKKLGVIVLVLLLFGLAFAGGCLGGGGKGNTSKTHSESSNLGSGSSTSGTEGSSEGSGGGTETTSFATWRAPWDAYNPVNLSGEKYYITYVRYTFTVKTPSGKHTYEVEKRRGYVKAHVYANENGRKKDLGVFNLFAYYEKLTPINNPNMTAPFECLILVKERTNATDEHFLNPLPNFGALGTGDSVVAEIRYGNNYFYWSNPPAIGQYSESQYTEGSIESVMKGLRDYGDYIAQEWVSILGSGAWKGLKGHNLLRKDEYNFSFAGGKYHFKIKPDGTVTLDRKEFRVSNVEWSYSEMGIAMQGNATIAPALPIPLETEGAFSSGSGGVYAYSRFKLEDIKLEKEFKGINVSIEKP